MKFKIHPQSCDISYTHDFISVNEADDLLNDILNKSQFSQYELKIYGNIIKSPRLNDYYSNPNCVYSYSGITLQPKPWIPSLKKILDKINNATNCGFNSCLINYYRNGLDYIGYHADNEMGLGDRKGVAVISLGVTRSFYIKNNGTGDILDVNLEHGSLFWMAGETQKHFKHSLPKRTKIKQPRISLTFRKVPVRK